MKKQPVNNLKKVFEYYFNEYIDTRGLDKGVIEVTLEEIVKDFNTLYPTLPVSNNRFGRALSKLFFKRQESKSGNTLYYLNKGLKYV